MPVTISTLEVPSFVQALFGDPPLLRGEDDGIYHHLMEYFIKLVEPKGRAEAR